MRHRALGNGSVLLLCLLAGALQSACAGSHVFGGIPPASFQFTKVVPYEGAPTLEPGGWKVAKVLILLGRLSPMFPEAASCGVEVGVPEFARRRVITDAFAQFESARAADAAARRVFQQRLPTAQMCHRFRGEMEGLLRGTAPQYKGPIPGARVTGFSTQGIPHTTFP
jgi:hypothetical protein